jgi:hypothetical protein
MHVHDGCARYRAAIDRKRQCATVAERYTLIFEHCAGGSADHEEGRSSPRCARLIFGKLMEVERASEKSCDTCDTQREPFIKACGP